MRVVIAGAGKVGRSIAKELVANGHDVLLVDRDAECIRPESHPRSRMAAGRRVRDRRPRGHGP